MNQATKMAKSTKTAPNANGGPGNNCYIWMEDKRVMSKSMRLGEKKTKKAMRCVIPMGLPNFLIS